MASLSFIVLFRRVANFPKFSELKKKNYYKTKLFITKIYSIIDKCHTIFALLAPLDKTGRKAGSND